MIKKMTQANLNDYNRPSGGFSVIGRLVPEYRNGSWSFTEELFEEHYHKQYDEEKVDDSYIDNEDKAVYLYYDGDRCMGRIKLRANWNGFAVIEEIYVDKDSRGKGIGTVLLRQAVVWAQTNGLIGLMLETQDVNLQACRFYASNQFTIGAVDTQLYARFPTAHEKAIFWYYRF